MSEILMCQLDPGLVQYRADSEFGRAMHEKNERERLKIESETLLERRRAELVLLKSQCEADWQTHPSDLIEALGKLQAWQIVVGKCEARVRETRQNFTSFRLWADVGFRLSRRLERLQTLTNEDAPTFQSPAQRRDELEEVLGEIEAMTGVRPELEPA